MNPVLWKKLVVQIIEMVFFMKIVLLSELFPPKWFAGTEIATYNIATHLAESKHEVHVVTSSDSGILDFYEENGFCVHRATLPRVKVLGMFLFALGSLKLIIKIRPEIVHAQNIMMGITGYLSKKVLKIPYVVWCQGSDVYLPWFLKKQISKIILKNADAIMVLSQNMKNEIRTLCECENKLIILPNGVNIEDFRPHPRNYNSKMKKNLIFVGTLRPIKGVRYLIEAFKIISNKRHDVQLNIVGDGEERDILERLTVSYGLAESVNFIGGVSSNKIPEYLADADIFVLPSLSEGMPLVILEAMASGLPIIATGVGGLPDILQNGDNGFLVQPRSPGLIAEKILYLLENENVMREIAENNVTKVQQFSWRSVVERLERHYSHILSLS